MLHIKGTSRIRIPITALDGDLHTGSLMLHYPTVHTSNQWFDD
jgi:hypothetical protein